MSKVLTADPAGILSGLLIRRIVMLSPSYVTPEAGSSQLAVSSSVAHRTSLRKPGDRRSGPRLSGVSQLLFADHCETPGLQSQSLPSPGVTVGYGLQSQSLPSPGVTVGYGLQSQSLPSPGVTAVCYNRSLVCSPAKCSPPHVTPEVGRSQLAVSSSVAHRTSLRKPGDRRSGPRLSGVSRSRPGHHPKPSRSTRRSR